MPHLRYINESGVPAAVELVDREVVIGRLPDCDIVVSDKTASRRHARVHRVEGAWRVSDLGSSHGTKVNGSKVKDSDLVHNDSIKIGEAEITFLDESLSQSPKRSKSRQVSKSAIDLTAGSIDPFELTDPTQKRKTEVVEEQKVEKVGALMRTTISAKEFDLNDLERQSASDGERHASEGGRLLALVRISDEIHRCPDVESVCRTATEMAMRATGADRGMLGLG